jgi:hypothetical protein
MTNPKARAPIDAFIEADPKAPPQVDDEIRQVDAELTRALARWNQVHAARRAAVVAGLNNRGKK